MNRFIALIREAKAKEENREFTKAFNLYAESEKFTTDESALIKIKAKKAWCLHSVGNPQETETLFMGILDQFHTHPLSITVYSRYLIKLKKFKSAKTLLRTGIEQFPSYMENYLILASLLKDMERSKEAIDVLKLALSREDLSRGKGIERKDIWAELGSLYFSRGDFNSALACLKKALKLDNAEDFLYYDLLALCYLEFEDYENALGSINTFMQYRGDADAENLIIFARIKCRLGYVDEAAQILIQAYSYEDSLSLKPHDFLDFAPLLRNGFFTTLENVDWEDE
ncbi:tetratricopeptide repeat protein [Leptospira idonii]|uniref:Tetratricopeptide repeat protein n=1 Tax=Leptospira idonii TaxID=1193500 RepID=A0A4R9M5U3_9LEPT|nr:tetratricopeptide repeat protein [Leptospira idonii]TGN20088.1 tetratricopeptide repeat protein [Leptospira idonii]